MATKYISEIASRLMKHGRSPEEPVAVITKASLPDQHVLETRLSTCADDIEKNSIEPPAVIVVGEVVSLRKYLKWMD
jgi:uroporphyrin-III C-methyltransferase